MSLKSSQFDPKFESKHLYDHNLLKLNGLIGFSLSLTHKVFEADPDRKHVFSCVTQDVCDDFVRPWFHSNTIYEPDSIF